MAAPGSGGDGSLAELESVILQQASAARQMLEALGQEQSALGERDGEALGLAAAVKSRALEALERLEERRRQLCRNLGAGTAPNELAAWLAAQGERGSAAAQLSGPWQQLSRVLADCHRLNTANGMAVMVLQRRVQQALNLVRTGSSEPAGYGPGGDALNGPPARAIAQA